MLKISYTVSNALLQDLTTIESLRKDILCFPLPLKKEINLQFEASISRITYGLELLEIPVKKEEVIKILSNQNNFIQHRKQKLTDQLTNSVIGYKRVFDSLKQEWMGTKQSVSARKLIAMYRLISDGDLVIPESQIQEILNYLDISAESPIIQAGIAKLQFIALPEFSKDNELFSTFCSYLFLYKAGLDFRGMLELEKHWSQNKSYYIQIYQKTLSTGNITGWLEYFSLSLRIQLNTAYQEIKQSDSKNNHLTDKATELNERQKAILSILDIPQSVISNKRVQKLFKISQITASRDLGKLASLGLLFVHGKGRSVRYTKT